MVALVTPMREGGAIDEDLQNDEKAIPIVLFKPKPDKQDDLKHNAQPPPLQIHLGTPFWL